MVPDQHHSAVSRVSFFQDSRRDENRPRRNASSQRLERASVPRWSSRTPTPPLELEWSADFASFVLSRKQHPCGKVSEGKALLNWYHSSGRKDRAFESEWFQANKRLKSLKAAPRPGAQAQRDKAFQLFASDLVSFRPFHSARLRPEAD